RAGVPRRAQARRAAPRPGGGRRRAARRRLPVPADAGAPVGGRRHAVHLERLELTDFRSYAEADLSLGPGVRVLVGPNAQGKTNLLEAIAYLATGTSHRVPTDAPLVRAGAEAAVVRAQAR